MNTLLIIFKSMLNSVISFLLIISWCWYMLATSDVPVSLAIIDVVILGFFFVFTLICLIVEIIVAKKYRFKGSILLVCVGVMSFVLWGGLLESNFSICDFSTNAKCLLLEAIGMIVSSVAVVSQFVQVT